MYKNTTGLVEHKSELTMTKFSLLVEQPFNDEAAYNVSIISANRIPTLTAFSDEVSCVRGAGEGLCGSGWVEAGVFEQGGVPCRVAE